MFNIHNLDLEEGWILQRWVHKHDPATNAHYFIIHKCPRGGGYRNTVRATGQNHWRCGTCNAAVPDHIIGFRNLCRSDV